MQNKIQVIMDELFKMSDFQLDEIQGFIARLHAKAAESAPTNLSLVPEEQHDKGVPTEKILELYHRHCPKLPRVKEFNDTRRRAVVARWRENKDRQTLAWWVKYFTFINERCSFLTGNNQSGWRANFNFVMKKGNMLKIIENEYVPRRAV